MIFALARVLGGDVSDVLTKLLSIEATNQLNSNYSIILCYHVCMSYHYITSTVYCTQYTPMAP